MNNRSRKRRKVLAAQASARVEGLSDDEGGRQQHSSREPVYLAMPFAKISGVIHCVPRAPKHERDMYILAWNRFASAGMLYTALPSDE